MPLVAAPPQLLTAEEYFGLRLDRPTELVRGTIVDMSRPAPIHGYVMMNFGRVLGNFAIANKLGRIVGGDSAVITERDPDSVRGPDVAFYSFARFRRGRCRKTGSKSCPISWSRFARSTTAGATFCTRLANTSPPA